MKVTIVSAYPFHMVDQARQVARLGVLERMVTTVPAVRISVPRSKVRSRPYVAGFRHLARRVVPNADERLSRVVVQDFDRWAARQLGSPTVVNALSGFATRTLEQASAYGIGVCSDRGSWHILEQKQVLDDEADRIGCSRIHFDPFIVERELREYDFVDRIFVPSEPARESFLRRGVDPSRVTKVPYGVDISRFNPPNTAPKPGAIVSVGTVGLRKGHRYLVDAFRSLRTSSASLTLVGPVHSGWRYRLDLDRGDVRTTGAVSRDRVVLELQRASVFALASLEEGLALVLAQAMACGLPVVATEATGVRELVTDGVEGLIVPAGDSAAMARAFDELLADPERAAEMGRAARRRVEVFGGWDGYGEQIVDVLRGLHEDRS